MDCPRCKTKLLKGERQGEKAYVCESCSGLLVRQPQLPTILEAFSAELFSEVNEDANLPKIEGKTHSINCPDCRLTMENYGYMGSNKVMLDACNECTWIWLDAQELMAVAQMYVQTGKRQRTYIKSFRPADVVSTHMITSAIGMMYGKIFLF